jgi:hypothetical protein
MRSWLENDAHRDTLLDGGWVDQGVALRKPPALFGLTDEAIWVSQFGRRQPLGADSALPSAVQGVSRGRPEALRTSVRPTRAISGRRVRFRFVVSFSSGAPGRAVGGATVSFAGRRTQTDAEGHATMVMRLRRAGRYRVVAMKAGRKDTVIVRVVRR